MFPLTIADTPFLIENPKVAEKVLTKYIDKLMKDKIDNAVFLGASSTDSYQIFGNEPIKSAKDLKNKKISDSVIGRINLYKKLGATPVTLTNADLYESLERGITDLAVYTSSRCIWL